MNTNNISGESSSKLAAAGQSESSGQSDVKGTFGSREAQVLASSGSGQQPMGHGGAGASQSSDKVLAQRKAAICDKCNTEIYGVDLGKCTLLEKPIVINFSGQAPAADKPSLSSACSAYANLRFIANLMGVTHLPPMVGSDCPPCSFYAGLDHQDSSKPAANFDIIKVFIAQNARMARQQEHTQPPKH